MMCFIVDVGFKLDAASAVCAVTPLFHLQYGTMMVHSFIVLLLATQCMMSLDWAF